MTSQPNRKRGQRVAPKKVKKVNERRRMIIMIVLAVIMSLIAVVCVLYRLWFVEPELPPVSESNPPLGSVQPSENPVTPDEPDYDPVEPMVSGERKSKNFYTFLVFGTDESSNLTDTMMVVSYDLTNQKATVMSLPRDTLINVKRSYKKLNGVYSWYGGGEDGIAALKNEVSELIGFMPDYYVKIDWEIVGQMVEAIGGVYFDVPRDMWYVDPYQDLAIDLDAGYQKLNGSQAMQLVRWRKNMDPKTYKVIYTASDIERLEIQHSFLKAVLKQVLQFKNVTRISELAKVFGENVVSDLTVKNLFWFGSQAIMGGLSVDSVQFCTMPWIAGKDYKGNDYVFPIWSKMLTMINEHLNPYVEGVTMNQLDLMEVRTNGTLASCSGVLADPDMGVLPPEESKEPEPDVSQDPGVPDDPEASEEPDVMEEPMDPEEYPDPSSPYYSNKDYTQGDWDLDDTDETEDEEDDILWMPI